MIFTGKVEDCKVRAFACLVDAEEHQMTVLDLVVKPGKQEVGLILPLPGLGKLVSTYAAHIDDVSMCFDDMMSEQLFEAAQAHRTDISPQYFSTFDDLVGAIFCPDSVREYMRPLYATGFSFLFLSFSEETATGPIAYIHDARDDKRLFIPGRSTEHLFTEEPPAESISGSDDISYNHTVFTVNTRAAGVPPFTRRIQNAFRWDLVPSIKFPTIDNLHMFTHQGKHPNSDVFFMSSSTPRDSRLYLGGDGALFRDNTRLRIVQYYPCGLRTFPIINGAYLTSPGESDPFHFGGSECQFDECQFPGTKDWAIRVIDEVDTETPIILWVKPWATRHELGKVFLDLIEVP